MPDKDNGIPRRKALMTTAGVGSALVGLPSVTGADDGSETSIEPGRRSDYILDDDYWRNENGRVEFDHANFEEWEIDFRDSDGTARATSQFEDLEVYVGKQRNATLDSGSPVRNLGGPSMDTAFRPLFDTYVTLAGGTIPNYVPGIGGSTWGFGAGVKFNVATLSVEIEITFKVGNTEVVLWGWELGYQDSKGLCASVTPSQFPVEISPCIDIALDGDSLHIGGSIDLCAPPNDPCPGVDCQYCITGIGYSEEIPLP